MEITTQESTQHEKKVNVNGLVDLLKKNRVMAKRWRFFEYSAEQVFDMLIAACRAEVELRSREFVLSGHMGEHLYEVAQWLTDSKDTHFGLFLSGGIGNGKTTILKAIQSLVNLYDRNIPGNDPGRGCIIISAKELNRLAKAYYNPSRDTQNEAEMFKRLRNIEILGIDDMGTEPRETMYYGDYITPVIDILSERYDRQACTLISTNLTAGEIGKFYDMRIADRFREMMKVISFSGEKSFR